MESPRADAELLAAHRHGVQRSKLHPVPDADFDPRFWDDVAPPRGQGAAAAHHRDRLLQVPRPRGRPGRVRAETGDRGHDRLGDRAAQRDGRGRAGGRGPRAPGRARSRWPSPRKCPGPGFTRSRAIRWPRPGPSATSPGARRPPRTPRAGSRCIPADFDVALAELDGTVDLVVSNPPYIPVDAPAAAGGKRVRADRGAVLRRRRPERDPGGRTSRPAAAAAGGKVAVEHGSPQGAAVYWVFAEETGWQQTRNHSDLAGLDRFVTATWP